MPYCDDDIDNDLSCRDGSGDHCDCYYNGDRCCYCDSDEECDDRENDEDDGWGV